MYDCLRTCLNVLINVANENNAAVTECGARGGLDTAVRLVLAHNDYNNHNHNNNNSAVSKQCDEASDSLERSRVRVPRLCGRVCGCVCVCAAALTCCVCAAIGCARGSERMSTSPSSTYLCWHLAY